MKNTEVFFQNTSFYCLIDYDAGLAYDAEGNPIPGDLRRLIRTLSLDRSITGFRRNAIDDAFIAQRIPEKLRKLV